MKWTKEQSDAIYTRDKNILVSASAGSGKTAVLSERVLTLIKEGYDIDRFLIFTFTKASAKEMKHRIYKKILKEYKQTKSNHLKRQLEIINSSHISTIHSFCMSVVKESFYCLDIPPRFNICTDVENAIIDGDVLQAIMEENYKDATEDFNYVSSIFEGNLDFVVLSLASHLGQQIDKETYIQNLLAYYENEDEVRELIIGYIDDAKAKIRNKINSLLSFASQNDKIVDILKSDLALLEETPCMKGSFARYNAGRKLTNEQKEISEKVKQDRNEYKKIVDDLNTIDIDFEVKSHAKNIVLVRELCRLANEFLDRSFNTRVEKKLLSFNDLEMLTKKALENDDIATIYKKRFDFVFVDEYQDTSDIQEYIIDKITTDNNAFMVGDVKQSIYSFRQANPEIFISKYNKFKQDDLSERIDLNKNFRSSSRVLDAVNQVFDVLMTEDFGGINYKENARLEFGNDALKNLDSMPKVVFVKSDNDFIKKQYEYVSKEVKKLVESGKKYSDIVILSRSLASSVVEASEVLRAQHIPFYFDYSESYLDSLEVEILLNYLRLINNFRNDLALLSVIRLPRYHFSDDEIYQIRLSNREVPIYDTLLSYNADDVIKEKINFFIDEMKTFRRYEFEMSLDELIQRIYFETDFEKYVYLLDKPKQRLANIRYLFSIASDYESSTMVGLNAFLKFIERVKSGKKDFSGTNIISDKNDVLRIMSIHKSKGLEFDTVFVVGCQKKFNERDYTKSYVFSGDYIEFNNFDVENRVNKNSLVKKIRVNALKKKLHEEEIRLLYVALTRAVNKLYIVSSIKKEEDVKRYTRGESNSFFKYMSSLYYSNTVVREDIEDVELTVEENDFSYDVDFVEVKELDFEKEHKASKKSVTSIVHGKKEASIGQMSVNTEAMKRGSEFHRIMQWIDFDKEVEDEFERFLSLGLVEDTYSIELVKKFFASKLYQMIKDSVKIERELEFVYRDEDFIQGIIDLVIHTSDGVIIVDYKTDTTLSSVDSYKKQLDYYALAYEKVRNERVVAKYLYFVKMDNLYIVD